MISIKSNIDKVMERTAKRLAALRAAPAAVLDRELWLAEAMAAAEGAVRAILAPREEGHVAGFIKAVRVDLISGGMAWTLEWNAPNRDVLPAVKGNIILGGLPLFEGELAGLRGTMDDLVLEWVEAGLEGDPLGKRIDVRDAGQTAAQIAEKIKGVLFGYRSSERVDATKEIMPHLQAFINANSGASGLAPETAAVWLKTVIEAWKVLIGNKMPGMIREAIKKGMDGS
jgi:hypothetical protein